MFSIQREIADAPTSEMRSVFLPRPPAVGYLYLVRCNPVMLHSYVTRYSMTPYAGVFIATVGVCVMAGAVLPNQRGHLVWIGFVLGTMLLVAFGQILSTGLHTPSLWQVSFLALAIVLEIAGFRYLMPILRPRGERATIAATVGIVGMHFLVMFPAFGPLIGALGIACTFNAAAFWRFPAYPTGIA